MVDRPTTCSTQFLFGKPYEQFHVKWILVSALAILGVGSIMSASAAFIVGRAIAAYGSAGILNGVLMCVPLFLLLLPKVRGSFKWDAKYRV
jgi:hypothetical protein